MSSSEAGISKVQLNMLQDKIVVITGGAGLLGREFSTAVAGAGGTAVIADLNLDAAEGVAEEVNRIHPCALKYNAKRCATRK